MEDADKAMDEKVLSDEQPIQKGTGAGKFKVRRRVRTAIFVVLGLVVLLGGLAACLTHGWLWSIYVPIYDRLLRSVPSPPALVEGTETTTLNPELPWGYKQYQVNQPHEDSVGFFSSRLPEAGWDLLEHKGWQSELEPGTLLKVDQILFSRNGRYWLIVGITTRVAVDGTALKPSRVIVEVHRNKQEATRRY